MRVRAILIVLHLSCCTYPPQLRVRDFTKLAVSPVFGVTKAEKAAKGGGAAGSEESGGGGLTLRDYQLEVGAHRTYDRRCCGSFCQVLFLGVEVGRCLDVFMCFAFSPTFT